MARLGAFATLLLAILAGTFLVPAVRAQRGTVLPASTFYFGSFRAGATICYSNSVVTSGLRLTPAVRSFSFLPTAAQMMVRYIEIISTDGQKFYAQIINGGVGTANPLTTDILVTAVHGSNLNVAVRIFCGA